jgi:hypothetical protein
VRRVRIREGPLGCGCKRLDACALDAKKHARRRLEGVVEVWIRWGVGGVCLEPSSETGRGVIRDLELW